MGPCLRYGLTLLRRSLSALLADVPSDGSDDDPRDEWGRYSLPILVHQRARRPARALLNAVWWAREELNLRPLPCQQTTGNRCANRRCRRSPRTVGAEVKWSPGVQLSALFARLEWLLLPSCFPLRVRAPPLLRSCTEACHSTGSISWYRPCSPPLLFSDQQATELAVATINRLPVGSQLLVRTHDLMAAAHSRDPMAIRPHPVDGHANAIPTCSGGGGSLRWSAPAPRRSRAGRS